MRLSRNKIQKALKKRKESYKRFRKRKRTDNKAKKTARKQGIINLRNKTVKKYGKRIHKGGAAGPIPIKTLNNILAGDNDIPFPKDTFFKRFSLAQLKKISSDNNIPIADDESKKKIKAPYINAIKQKINEKRKETTPQEPVETPRPKRRVRVRVPSAPKGVASGVSTTEPPVKPILDISPTIATQTETVSEKPTVSASDSVPMKSPQITAYTVNVESLDQPGMGWLSYKVVDKDGKKHVKTAEEMLYLLQHGTSENVSVHKFDIKSGIATQTSNPEDKKKLIEFLNSNSPSIALIQRDDVNVVKIDEPAKKLEKSSTEKDVSPQVRAVSPPTAPPVSPTAPPVSPTAPPVSPTAPPESPTATPESPTATPESPLFPPAPSLPDIAPELPPSVPVLFPPVAQRLTEKEEIEKRVQENARDRADSMQAAKDTEASARETDELLAQAREVSRKAKRDNPETLGNIESLGGGGRRLNGGSSNIQNYVYVLWIRHCFGCHNRGKFTFGVKTGYRREPLCTDKGVVESIKFGNKLPEKLQEYKKDGKLPETMNKIRFNSSVLPRAMQTMLLVERSFIKKNKKTKDEDKRFHIPDHEVHRVNYVQEKYVRGVESLSNSSRNVTHKGKSNKHANFYNKTIGKGIVRIDVDNIIGDYPNSSSETLYKFSSDDYSRFKQKVIPEFKKEPDSENTVFAIVSHGQYLRKSLGFDEKLKNLDAVLVRYPIGQNGQVGDHEIIDRYDFNREVMNTVSPNEYSKIIELVQQTGLDTKFMNCTYSYNNDIIPIADSQYGGRKTRKQRKKTNKKKNKKTKYLRK